MIVLIWLFADIVSGGLCYKIASDRNLNRNVWLMLGLALGPLALPFLLLKESKPPQMFTSREKAYSKYLEEEGVYKRAHVAFFNKLAKIIGMAFFLAGGLATFGAVRGLISDWSSGKIHSEDLGPRLVMLAFFLFFLLSGAGLILAKPYLPKWLEKNEKST